MSDSQLPFSTESPSACPPTVGALALAFPEDPPDPGDPPTPDAEVVEAEPVDPEALIPTSAIVARMEGITAEDRVRAVLLGRAALEIQSIDDDVTEERVGALIDALIAHEKRLDGKVRRFIDVAFRLHRALTGFLNGATEELRAGLAHLKPLLARRLKAKRDAEEARQRAEREAGLQQERERILAEAQHAEATGESPEVVQQLIDEAATVAPPPVAARPVTALKGASTRDNWKAELLNKRAVILHIAQLLLANDESLLNLLDLNQQAANQLAKVQKGTMRIPGLRAYNDIAFTKRRAS